LKAAWSKKVELAFALEDIASMRGQQWWGVVCRYGALLGQAEETDGALAAPLAAIRQFLARQVGKEMEKDVPEGGPLRLTRVVLDRLEHIRKTMCAAFAPHVFREMDNAAGWCHRINKAEQMDLLLDCRSIAAAVGDASAAEELWKKTAELLEKAPPNSARRPLRFHSHARDIFGINSRAAC
jgi:hypothetical protein